MALTAILDKHKIYVDSLPEKELRLASSSGNLKCPLCECQVFYKKGDKKSAHFAHGPEEGNIEFLEACSVKDDSEIHNLTKNFLRDILRDEVYKGKDIFTDIEHKVGDRIYDAYLEIGDKKLGLEIQKSDMSVDYVEEKFRDSAENDVHVLYILVPSYFFGYARSNPNHETRRVKAVEDYLHGVYGGRLYYSKGSYLNSVHLYNKKKKVYGNLPLIIDPKSPEWSKFPLGKDLLNVQFKEKGKFKLASFNDGDYWKNPELKKKLAKWRRKYFDIFYMK